MGSIGGWFWTHGGWSAVAGFAGALLVIALLVSGHLWRYARRVETRPV
jgi:YNFM family putative membrane transporter